LTIIKNGTEIKKDFDFVDYNLDIKSYEEKNLSFTHIMSLSDISLGFDSDLFKRHIVFFSGEKVVFEQRDRFNTLCIVYQNKILGVLSSQLNSKILEKLNAGYIFKDIYIEYIVNWYDSEEKKYLKHPLCKIVMEK